MHHYLYIEWSGGLLHCALHSVNSMQDWEMEFVGYLFNQLYKIKGVRVGGCALLGPTIGKQFRVKSFNWMHVGNQIVNFP